MLDITALDSLEAAHKFVDAVYDRQRTIARETGQPMNMQFGAGVLTQQVKQNAAFAFIGETTFSKHIKRICMSMTMKLKVLNQ